MKRIPTTLALTTTALMAVLNPVLLTAQELPDTIQAEIELYLTTEDGEERETSLSNLTSADGFSDYIFQRFEQDQPDRIDLGGFRRDLHLGTASSTAGSTSVISLPAATDLISAAIETGAVSRRADDKSVTFGVNSLPIYQMMTGRVPSGCGNLEQDCRTGFGRWIRGLSASASLGLGGATTPVALDGGAVPGGGGLGSAAGFLLGGQNLSGVSVRYELFVRERESELDRALDAAAVALSDPAGPFLSAQADFLDQVRTFLTRNCPDFDADGANPDLAAVDAAADAGCWISQTRTALRNAGSVEAAEDILEQQYRIAYAMVFGPQGLGEVSAAVNIVRLDYIREQNRVLAEKLYRKAFTVDYVHQRPTDQPWFHQLRFVASTPLGGKPGPAEIRTSMTPAAPEAHVTFNGGVTFYHSVRGIAAHRRVRDAQASFALDWSPAAWGRVRPTFTAAYYFQYMIENGFLQLNGEAVTPGGSAIPLAQPAMEVLNTKGPIHVAQLRVSIPAGDSGISIPFAVSYASRAELITGRAFWQGHVGVAYDFSNLKSLFIGDGGE